MAKDCLILASSALDLKPVAAMAEVAVVNGTESFGRPIVFSSAAKRWPNIGRGIGGERSIGRSGLLKIPFLIPEPKRTQRWRWRNII